MNVTHDEPLLTTSVILGLVAAVITCVVAFGGDLSQDQTAAILGVTSIVAPLLVGIIARLKVSPSWKVTRFDTVPMEGSAVVDDQPPIAPPSTPPNVQRDPRKQ